jgi:hypothetical protein
VHTAVAHGPRIPDPFGAKGNTVGNMFRALAREGRRRAGHLSCAPPSSPMPPRVRPPHQRARHSKGGTRTTRPPCFSGTALDQARGRSSSRRTRIHAHLRVPAEPAARKGTVYFRASFSAFSLAAQPAGGPGAPGPDPIAARFDAARSSRAGGSRIPARASNLNRAATGCPGPPPAAHETRPA